MVCKVTLNFCKTPDEVLDYHVDWSAWLDTDSIVTSKRPSRKNNAIITTARRMSGIFSTVFRFKFMKGDPYLNVNVTELFFYIKIRPPKKEALTYIII